MSKKDLLEHKERLKKLDIKKNESEERVVHAYAKLSLSIGSVLFILLIITLFILKH